MRKLPFKHKVPTGAHCYTRARKRHYFDSLAKHLGIRRQEEWTKVTEQKVRNFRGSFILQQHNESVVDALQHVYPEFDWSNWFTSETILHQRRTFDNIADRLYLEKLDDWYRVDVDKLIKRGIAPILHSHENLLSTTLQNLYPEFSWMPWKFSQTLPVHFWNKMSMQRWYFDWVADESGIEEKDSWHEVKITELFANFPYLKDIVHHFYSDSLPSALSCVYPEYEWIPWMFHQVNDKYWSHPYNQRRYFDWLADQMGIESQDGYYKLQFVDISNRHGGGLLHTYYNDSGAKAVEEVYPEMNWLPWLFEYRPRGFWQQFENQRRYFDWLAEQLDVKQQSDWYTIATHQTFNEHVPLLKQKYFGSYPQALRCVYPEFTWHTWKFIHKPQKYWDNMQHQREFFDWIGEELCIETSEQWYGVTLSEVQQRGGDSVLHLYGNSLCVTLNSVYPEYQWHESLFVDEGHWSDINTHRKFFSLLSKRLNIQAPDQWYRVRLSDVTRGVGGKEILNRYGSLYNALTALYPEHKWVPWKFFKVPSGYWEDSSNVSRYVEWLADTLNVHHHSDWNRVSLNQISMFHGGSLVTYGLLRTSPQSTPHLIYKSKAHEHLFSVLGNILSHNSRGASKSRLLPTQEDSTTSCIVTQES